MLKKITHFFWNKSQLPRFSQHSFKYNNLAFEDIPEVSTAMIRKKLRQNNTNFEEGFTCFVVECKFCLKSTKSAKLYINKTTG